VTARVNVTLFATLVEPSIASSSVTVRLPFKDPVRARIRNWRNNALIRVAFASAVNTITNDDPDPPENVANAVVIGPADEVTVCEIVPPATVIPFAVPSTVNA